MLGRVATYFGFPQANPDVLRIAKIFAVLGPVTNAIMTISSTFYIIFVAEALGNGDFIVGMTLVGLLVVIQMTVQTIMDYPTGVVGDWIGQRYILASAFITYGITYYLVSIVTSESPFFLLVIIYALTGFAASQQSGALGAWFDNNYRIANPGDTQRKQYGVFRGKLNMLFWFSNVLIIIPGGILAVWISRAWVFQLQATLCILLAVVAFLLIHDLPGVAETKQARPTLDEYLSLLREGLAFLNSGPFVRYLLLGNMLITSVIAVWGNLVIFPVYYQYLVSDTAVAAMRTIVMIPLVIYAERSGVWAKRFEPRKWIPRMAFIQTAGAVFFWVFSVILFVFPPPSPTSSMLEIMFPGTDILVLAVPSDALVPVFLMMATFFTFGITYSIIGVLYSQVFIDAIPNRVRNGVYSLFPTIILILSIPQISFFGWLIPIGGLSLTLILMGLVSTVGVILLAKAFTHYEIQGEEIVEQDDDIIIDENLE
ncbi:MAG: MFS transporter [Candidatus Thorarchaeota archaeon]